MVTTPGVVIITTPRVVIITTHRVVIITTPGVVIITTPGVVIITTHRVVIQADALPQVPSSGAGVCRSVPSVSAIRGSVHVLRVGFPQGYEVHAFTTLLRHLANFRIAERNSRLHKPWGTKSVQRFFQKVLCSIERFNVCLSIVQFWQMKGPLLWSLVREKSGWFLWAEFQEFWACAQECAKIHTGVAGQARLPR